MNIGFGYNMDTATWTANDEKAKEALKALIVISNYLESECAFTNSTEWVDNRGYSFDTDMGYFWQGLENLENCLIIRLRGGTPKYPKACETYKEDERPENQMRNVRTSFNVDEVES